MIETRELLNPKTIVWAVAITFGVFFIRGVFLKIVKIPLNPMLFVAPRGLITILLFLSIPVEQKMDLVDRSVIIQVIILSALIMMVGFMIFNKKEKA